MTRPRSTRMSPVAASSPTMPKMKLGAASGRPRRTMSRPATNASTLTVSAKQSGDRIEVVFEDTGSGIGDDILPKIFEPFFTTRPRGEGAGLGLTIAHRIIAALGGSIQVKTTPKHGSAFSVSLPAGGADGS